MIKKTVTYKNFDGVEETVDVYFNISKAELLEVEMLGGDESFGESLKEIAQSQDKAKILEAFDGLLKLGYGVRDGKHFRKSDELWADFKSTEAYSELLFDMFTKSDEAADFLVGMIPDVSDLEYSLNKGKTPKGPKVPTDRLPKKELRNAAVDAQSSPANAFEGSTVDQAPVVATDEVAKLRAQLEAAEAAQREVQ